MHNLRSHLNVGQQKSENVPLASSNHKQSLNQEAPGLADSMSENAEPIKMDQETKSFDNSNAYGTKSVLPPRSKKRRIIKSKPRIQP